MSEITPKWKPTPEEIKMTNLYAVMKSLGFEEYSAFHEWSVKETAAFWETVVNRCDIRFTTRFKNIVDLTGGKESPEWFPGAMLNIVDSCLSAPADRTAICYSNREGAILRVSYRELEQRVCEFATTFLDLGIHQTDKVAFCMPMTIDAIAAYLAVIKLGAVAVSIADSFSPEEISVRLKISEAKCVVCQDKTSWMGKTLNLYDKVKLTEPPKILVLSDGFSDRRALRPEDRYYDDVRTGVDTFQSMPSSPDQPINILFSSGTTGEPKAIPWTQITPIKCAMDGYFHQDIHPHDVVAWPTNLGWMMGPWLIFATFINKGTIALYHDAPLDEKFGAFVQNAKISVLGLVPSLVKVWRRSKCMEAFDWSGIKLFSSTGECSNADDYAYLMDLAGNRPVIEYCGGTEIGGGYITGTLLQPAAPGYFTTPAMGINFHILNNEDKPDTKGELFLVPPSVGLSSSLLNKDHHDVYYKDTPAGPNGELLRRHGDEFEKVGDFFRGLGRVDDTMNLGGIKTSAAEVEEVLSQVEGVKELAAVAVSPQGGGPSALVVFAVGAGLESEALKESFQKQLKTELNPLFKVSDVVVLEALPRTASNKIMRRVLRDQYSPN